MSQEELVANLLLRWEERQRLGQELAAEDLCRDCPELRVTITFHIQALKATSWLDRHDEADENTPPLSPQGREGQGTHASCSTILQLTMPQLCAALRRHHLLEPTQTAELEALAARWRDPKALCKELLARDWLTPYQVNQLLQGRGADLLLGSYVLLDRLGEGGMGAVFRARNWKLNTIVALKRIRQDRLSGRGAVRRFHREIQAAAQLDHPNIVRAFDADDAGGAHFMVMEYVEGTDLARLVKQKGPLPVQEACDCIRQAALGLQHALERGLTHRDIKPANLLMSGEWRVASGEKNALSASSAHTVRHSPLIKILDMGLARIAHGDDDEFLSTTLTQEGAVMGTPDFIAPEQAVDAHEADIRSDIYSLGCTFYFLLTGKAPFPGGTLMEKLFKHQHKQPAPIRSLRSEVPDSVVALIDKMMAKRPEDRQQTPAELVEDLANPGRLASRPANRPSAIRDLQARDLFSDFSGLEAAIIAKTPARSAAPAEQQLYFRWLLAGLALLCVPVVAVVAVLVFRPTLERGQALETPNGKSALQATLSERLIVARHLQRRVAEWALRCGGGTTVHIDTGNGSQLITDAEKLPNGDFQITGINFLNCALEPSGLKLVRDLPKPCALSFTQVPVTDAQFAELAQFKDITALTFYVTAVTDDGLKHLRELPQLTGLVLRDGKFTAAALPHLQDLRGLTSLVLYGIDIQGDALKYISQLTGMTQQLGFADCKLTDDDLRHIRKITKINNLYVPGNPGITDAGLIHLQDMKRLTHLTAYGSSITGTGLKNLGCTVSLISLSLGGSIVPKHEGVVTDAGLEQIARFTKLTTLGVEGKDISDAGVVHLAKLAELKSLNLLGPRITDEGAKHLHGLSSLERLDISKTSISKEGRAALQAALPGCKIVASYLQQRVAEWALNCGGKTSVQIVAGNRSETITDAGKLPNSDFQITSINFQECAVEPSGLNLVRDLPSPCAFSFTNAPLTDAQFAQLLQFKGITDLTLYETAVTDDGLKRLRELPQLTGLALRDGAFTSACLPHLQELRNLTSLGLHGIDIEDDALKCISNLPQLTAFYPSTCKLTDNALRHVSKMTKLDRLYVPCNPAITDAALVHLQDLKGLNRITAYGASITGAGLEHLSCTESLAVLELGGSNIPKHEGVVTDAGLEQIARFTKLEMLGVEGRDISDAGVAHLAKLTNLRQLYLSAPRVTDEGAKHLHNLRALADLDVSKTSISAAGKAALQAALPRCKIVP